MTSVSGLQVLDTEQLASTGITSPLNSSSQSATNPTGEVGASSSTNSTPMCQGRGAGVALGLAPLDVTRDEEVEEQVAQGTRNQNNRMNFDAHEIVDGLLWVGSARAAQSVTELKRHGIKRILNMSRRPISEKTQRELCVVSYDVKDIASQMMFATWTDAIHEIEDARKSNQPVLLCCHRGISRSVATACAYKMSTSSIGWETALQEVQSRRSIAAPNYEFCRQLYVFEKVGFDAKKAEAGYEALAEEFANSMEFQRMSPVPGQEGSRLQIELDSGYDSEASSALNSGPNTSTSHGDSSLSSCASKQRQMMGSDGDPLTSRADGVSPQHGGLMTCTNKQDSEYSFGDDGETEEAVSLIQPPRKPVRSFPRTLPVPQGGSNSNNSNSNNTNKGESGSGSDTSNNGLSSSNNESLGGGGMVSASGAPPPTGRNRQASIQGGLPLGNTTTTLSELRPGTSGDVLHLRPGVQQEDLIGSGGGLGSVPLEYAVDSTEVVGSPVPSSTSTAPTPQEDADASPPSVRGAHKVKRKLPGT